MRTTHELEELGMQFFHRPIAVEVLHDGQLDPKAVFALQQAVVVLTANRP